jgi:hypothetical protein
MDLAKLRFVIRSMVRDQQDQIGPSMSWHATDTFRQLSPAQQASVQALTRRLQHAHGNIGAILPAEHDHEWC